MDNRPTLKEMSFAAEGGEAVARMQRGGIWKVPIPPDINWMPRVLMADEVPVRDKMVHAEFKLVQVNEQRVLFGRFSDGPKHEWVCVD